MPGHTNSADIDFYHVGQDHDTGKCHYIHRERHPTTAITIIINIVLSRYTTIAFSSMIVGR